MKKLIKERNWIPKTLFLFLLLLLTGFGENVWVVVVEGKSDQEGRTFEAPSGQRCKNSEPVFFEMRKKRKKFRLRKKNLKNDTNDFLCWPKRIRSVLKKFFQFWSESNPRPCVGIFLVRSVLNGLSPGSVAPMRPPISTQDATFSCSDPGRRIHR